MTKLTCKKIDSHLLKMTVNFIYSILLVLAFSLLATRSN